MANPTFSTMRGFRSDGTTLDPSDAAFQLPRSADGRPSMQDWEDFSTRVLVLNGARTDGVKFPAADLVESAEIGPGGPRWDQIEWDPEVGLLVLIPDEDIVISTNKEGDVADDDVGITITAGTAFPLHVAGSPIGHLWVRPLVALTTTIIKAYGYGSANMVFSTRNAFNVNHD